MATLVEERDETVNEEVSDVNKIAEESAVVEQAAPAEEELPEKYHGKSLADIVRMHQESEKILGKQGTEVGELRKVVDDFIVSHNSSDSTKEPAEEIDFFTEPGRATQQAIDNHPVIRKAAEDSQNYKRSTALSELQRRHPDMANILKDDKFTNWVQSSNYRTKLYAKADSQYDYEAADEIFSAWQDRQSLVSETVSTEKAQRSSEVKKASTGSTGGSAQQGSRKVYRRADIIKLMQTDPDRYESLEPEIRQAYSEGRVK